MTRNRFLLPILGAMTLSSLAMVGCSKKEDPKKTDEVGRKTNEDAMKRMLQEQSGQRNLPQPGNPTSGGQ